MEKKDFQAAIGKTFTVTLGRKSVPLTLESVEPLEQIQGFEDAKKEPFALIFSGPNDRPLPDATYAMTVDGHPEEHICISAHNRDHKCIFYDAPFC